MSEDEFLSESTLGTKQYWDQFYDEELTNFQDHGDTGETWFGKRNALKIVNWIVENVNKDEYICDLGCGNGYILAQLASKGFSNLLGIDYSEKAIEFCEKMYSDINNCIRLRFQTTDILQKHCELNEEFEVILDKGTYDAICLMPNADLKLNRRKYLEFVQNHLQSGGHFVIMSCNFTKEELCKFLLEESLFELIHEFETPTLSFGGQTGKQVTGLVLRRNNK